MDENAEKRIIAFTSQSLKRQGIRAVRMDDIARNMNMSKRTIYQIYTSKENLIYSCLQVYQVRIINMFHIIKYDFPYILEYFWAVSKAYIENLYKAKCVFWFDISRDSKYRYIYSSYNRIWSGELEKIISVCQKEKLIMSDLRAEIFVESFTALLYNARLAECVPSMLYRSAYFMLRGIMTESGVKRFDHIPFEEETTGIFNPN